MARQTSSTSATKTSRKKVAQSKKRAASGASRTAAPKQKKQAAAASDEKTGSRLAGLFKSPIVRNIFAVGLVSAAAALLYKKRESDADTSQNNALDIRGPEAENSTAAERAASTRRRRATPRVKKTVLKEAVAGSTSDQDNVGNTTGRRSRKHKEGGNGAASATSGRGTKRSKAGTTGRARKPRAAAASPPAGIEAPVARLDDTETSAFAFSAPAEEEAAAVAVPASAPADDQR